MKTGHYLVTRPIRLKPPFEATCLGLGARFDVLAVAADYVLVRTNNELRDAGVRVWKPVKDFQDEHGCPKAICLTEKVVAEDGYHMVDPQPRLQYFGPSKALPPSINGGFEAKQVLAFLTADTNAALPTARVLQFPERHH